MINKFAQKYFSIKKMKCLFIFKKRKKKKTLWKHQNADKFNKELLSPNLSETRELRKIRES